MNLRKIQKKKGKEREKGGLWRKSGGGIEKEPGRESGKEKEKWNDWRGKEMKGQEPGVEADLDQEKERESEKGKGKEKGQDLEKETETGKFSIYFLLSVPPCICKMLIET